jgi:ubiquinone/menaquinone biosynthesis C-methylase UbiE
MERLVSFIDKLKSDVFSETLQSERWDFYNVQNTDIIIRTVKLILSYDFKKKNVLDVGFGSGNSLELFKKEGALVTGIGLSQVDLSVCKEKGFDVHIMDQSFMTFENETFDFIWSRHCLEHSFMPLYTLHEYYRVLKKGGYVYVEVPAPDTMFNHQNNPNHYSVLGKSSWLSLMRKTGFTVVDEKSLDLQAMIKIGGRDVYFMFILKKENL